jgi:hypothetical protein
MISASHAEGGVLRALGVERSQFFYVLRKSPTALFFSMMAQTLFVGKGEKIHSAK